MMQNVRPFWRHMFLGLGILTGLLLCLLLIESFTPWTPDLDTTQYGFVLLELVWILLYFPLRKFWHRCQTH